MKLKEVKTSEKVSGSLLGMIGNTPMVKLKKIPKKKGIDSSILCKLEMFNPSGSLKDRIYYQMITRAMEEGELKRRMEIVEASSGNAGISCSFVEAYFGYDVTIVKPRGMSEERVKIMEAYGAEVIFTPGGKSDVDLSV